MHASAKDMGTGSVTESVIDHQDDDRFEEFQCKFENDESNLVRVPYCS